MHRINFLKQRIIQVLIKCSKVCKNKINIIIILIENKINIILNVTCNINYRIE